MKMSEGGLKDQCASLAPRRRERLAAWLCAEIQAPCGHVHAVVPDIVVDRVVLATRGGAVVEHRRQQPLGVRLRPAGVVDAAAPGPPPARLPRWPADGDA